MTKYSLTNTGSARKKTIPRATNPEAPLFTGPHHAYSTSNGTMLVGLSNELLSNGSLAHLEGRVNLIFTSPPFPLNRKKRYGNETGQEYIEWLCEFGPLFKKMLAPNGSVVIEMGNSWEPGLPVMSTLAIKALLEFQTRNKFELCQEFIWQNPAKLPSPAQWVNIDRVRVKDSFTRLWWMSSTPNPKADNRAVLRPYSSSMKGLLKKQKYNPGKRPSEHNISETGFLKDNGGAISSNVLTYPNTKSADNYTRFCKSNGLGLHPARMPPDLAKFFVSFLTSPGDLVLDPFAGSNTTGSVAESMNRSWLSIEANEDYASGSRGRFGEKIIADSLGKPRCGRT